MHRHSIGTSLNNVTKLSLPVHDLGCVTLGRTPARRDMAVEGLILCTDEMPSVLSCSFLVAVV